MCNCKNVGPIDRTIRLVIGLVALVAAFAFLDVQTGSITGVIAAVLGVIMLGTAALGMCPLYLPFKLSTCRVPKAN